MALVSSLVVKTRTLSVLTLAPIGELKSLMVWIQVQKRFMHHYNPQYFLWSWPLWCARSSWNRLNCPWWACSYSSLAKFGKFPYAIHLVAEVLESNGSSSQLLFCRNCPRPMVVCQIKALAGIAMGLISDDITVLTDIKLKTTLEMDFKVTVLVTVLQPFKWISRFKGTAEILTDPCPSQESAFWNPWCDWSSHSSSSRWLAAKSESPSRLMNKIKIVISEWRNHRQDYRRNRR